MQTHEDVALPAPPETGPPPLSVTDLSVSFSGVRALDGVTFDVPPGVTALIGPNGAGKTTLLNCVSGLYRHSGEILLDGRSLGSAPAHDRARRGIARTFQTPALMDELDAVENVLLGAHSRLGRRWPWSARNRAWRDETASRAAALELLDRFGLRQVTGTPVADLPHGDRRRVETARALIGEPKVLLLDEPAAGLDDDEARELIAVAEELAGCCVLVEHNMQLVMSVAEHVVVLASGQLLATGTPQAVQQDERVVEAYLGDGVL